MSHIEPQELDNAVTQLATQLTEPSLIAAWLDLLGCEKDDILVDAVRRFAIFDLPIDLTTTLLRQITIYYQSHAGIDIGFVNLVEYLARSRSPLAIATLFERDASALPVLLKVLSIDGPLAEVILGNVEIFDDLRVVQGRAISRDELLADLVGEISALESDRSVTALLRGFREREILRIGYALLTNEVTAAWVSEQLSQLAEVICGAAFELGRRRLAKHVGQGRDEVRLVVLALNDCGSQGMHFQSTLPLVTLFSDSASNAILDIDQDEQAERITKSAVSLLRSDDLHSYEVSLRFWPHFDTTRHVSSAERALRALDQYGRTWQRLEMLTARVVAGNQMLGDSFLNHLEPWLYRRQLADADVDGLLFQYRNWRRNSAEGNLHELFQGIRILQMLLGGDHPKVRGPNPFFAIAPLADAGAWKKDEARLLTEDLGELAKERLLEQLGVPVKNAAMAKQRYQASHHLIASALENLFGDPPRLSLLSELVMNPLPAPEDAQAALSPYGFVNPLEASAALSELAQESTPFLSTRKSRHFLAKIAPLLASSLAKTPSPDHALFVLTHVVQSLGAKGALWELFLANPPSMELCVRLCAYSPYLSNILIANPGFIDELVDSLQLARLPSLSAMESRLEDLCKGAELEQAVHEFKNALHLRIGVRDILGKEEIASTHQSLAQAAEAILRRVVSEQLKELSLKLGKPMFETSHGMKECRHVMLVSGKVGALEPNYHSEVDFAVIYEGDGMTLPESRSMASVSCAHFFGQVTQRSVRRLTSRGKLGQLYVVNSNFRPLGSQGPLAASLEALRHYYLESLRTWRDLLWLCKSRPAGGDPVFAVDVMTILHKAIAGARITRAEVDDFRQFRVAQESGAKPFNLKRAAGGTQHVELLVQFLQLVYAARFPRILSPGTLAALDRLAAERLLTSEEAKTLSDRYRFLRSVESRLRLMNTQARHDLPENDAELRSLAMFVNIESADQLREQCGAAMRDIKGSIEGREVRLANEPLA